MEHPNPQNKPQIEPLTPQLTICDQIEAKIREQLHLLSVQPPIYTSTIPHTIEDSPQPQSPITIDPPDETKVKTEPSHSPKVNNTLTYSHILTLEGAMNRIVELESKQSEMLHLHHAMLGLVTDLVRLVSPATPVSTEHCFQTKVSPPAPTTGRLPPKSPAATKPPKPSFWLKHKTTQTLPPAQTPGTPPMEKEAASTSQNKDREEIS